MNTNTTMKEARCGKCKVKFLYEPVLVAGHPRSRHVCDSCRRTRKNYLTKQSHARGRSHLRKGDKEARTPSNEYESRKKIGQALGLDQSTVELIERTALAKIRHSPELKEAFAHYAEAGMPRVAELIGSLVKPDRSGLLLEYQMQVLDFWQVYERLVAEAAQIDAADDRRHPQPYADLPLWKQRQRQRDAGPKSGGQSVQAELEGILREIANMQKALKAELAGS